MKTNKTLHYSNLNLRNQIDDTLKQPICDFKEKDYAPIFYLVHELEIYNSPLITNS